MRSPRSLAFGIWLILLTLPGLASSAGPEIPSPQGEVTDLVGILDGGTRQELTRIIQGVRDRTTAEIAILVVPTTAPETIEYYSVAVFDQWKIGQRGKDNGLLFLVAIQDRRLHITTGYGLEGILPDGKVGEIRDRDILPLFRTGRYAEGILRGTQGLASVILGQPSEGAGARAVRGRSRFGSRYTGILLGIFILLVLFVMSVSAMDRPNALSSRGRRTRRGFWGPWWMGGGFGGGMGGWSGGGGGWSGGGFSSGGFGGFGGGSTGGGGAGGSW